LETWLEIPASANKSAIPEGPAIDTLSLCRHPLAVAHSPLDFEFAAPIDPARLDHLRFGLR
jgi:hypothetical protein